MIPNKLEKAIILSGSPGTAIFPLANYYPNFLFPIANEVLLKYMLHSLKKSGIMEVAIVSSANEKRLQAIISTLKEQDELQIHHLEQHVSRGTAGSLKQLNDFITASPFLVLGANLFIDELPMQKILAFHLAHGSGGTMVAEQISSRMEQLENIEFSKDGAVKKVHILHHSKDLRRHLKPSGIYVFNPCVLDYIFEKGYMDIKEQLIPLLSSNNIQVRAYTPETPPWKINSLADYLELNRKVLFEKKQQLGAAEQPRDEFLHGVRVGMNARIAPSAYLLGPIVIGNDCVIEEHAQIIGPTSIGSGTRIEADVLVRESIVWHNSHLKKNSSVEYSLISEGMVVSVNENIRNAVVVNNRRYPGSLNMLYLSRSTGKSFINKNAYAFPFSSYKSVCYYAFRAFKRGFDLLFSGVTLILSLPLFILIALAIKMDSSGPVFFCQKRCGMEGKEFNMYKFRTMGQGAEAIQDQLSKQKDVDGPMFKMVNDPRITKVGRILRKTSLDELPQFFNVLQGNMSVVGPRPLIMEEMKFSPSWRDIRLKVKPGITGLWQVSGRSDVAFHSWIESDICYVKNQSIRLDMEVLMRTFYHVIRGIGAR